MSDEIIKVLDDLAKRFGVAIDWTAENVLPLVKQAMSNLVTYKIVSNALMIALGVVSLIVAGVLIKQLLKPKANNRLYKPSCLFKGEHELTTSGGITACITGASAVFGVMCFCASIDELLRWAIMPEIQIITYIKDLLQ